MRQTITERGGVLKIGNPGNKGGAGVLPSVIRERCRGSFAKRIGFLEKLADGKITQEVPTKSGTIFIEASPADRVRAMDMLGKYGALQVLTTEAPEGVNESGEAMMARVLTMVGRALLSAPSASRAAVLAELSGVEASVAE